MSIGKITTFEIYRLDRKGRSKL